MNTPSLFTWLRRACLTPTLLLFAAQISPAQSVATGTIEGRVLNTRNGLRAVLAGTGTGGTDVLERGLCLTVAAGSGLAVRRAAPMGSATYAGHSPWWSGSPSTSCWWMPSCT